MPVTRANSRSYEFTATGILGDKRTSMLTNELHLRSELGKSKGHGHVFKDHSNKRNGLNTLKYDGGVKAALCWPNAGENFERKKKTGNDQYFGRPARPSTPINDVLTFKYQKDWMNERREEEMKSEKIAFENRIIPGAYRENITSQLRAASKPRNAQLISHLHADESGNHTESKFTREAVRRIDTFRTESMRTKEISAPA